MFKSLLSIFVSFHTYSKIRSKIHSLYSVLLDISNFLFYFIVLFFYFILFLIYFYFYVTARHYDRPLPESSSRIYRIAPIRCRVKGNHRVSVTNLGKKDPLIPGQQLYGTMIPRPEYDYNVHRNEIVLAEKNMKLFQSCMKQINDADNGLSEYEKKQLMKLDDFETTPMAVGYEVVPFDIGIAPLSEASSTDSIDEFEEEIMTSEVGKLQKLQISRRFTVKLISDTPGYIDSREANDLILESDGKNTYCVSEIACEVEVEEEGIEVIGTGRFTSSSYNNNCPFDEELVAVDSNNPQGVENRLSSVFSSNESIQVIFYRPPEGEILKCKEE